jgi:hypothetical protein
MLENHNMKMRFATGLVIGLSFAAGTALAVTSIPYISGSLTSGNVTVATSDGLGIQDGAIASSNIALLASPQTLTGNKTFSGNVIAPHPAAITSTGNLDPTSTNMCGGTVEYNSGSAGTLSILNSWPVGCNVSITAIGAGLATIAAGTGTVHVPASGGCNTPRTRAQYSTIWVRSSNTGGVGVVDVTGDCG